jgi:hypothetical protein
MSFVPTQPRSADHGAQYAAAAGPTTGLVRAAGDVAALATAEFAPRAQTYHSANAIAAG